MTDDPLVEMASNLEKALDGLLETVLDCPNCAELRTALFAAYEEIDELYIALIEMSEAHGSE